MKALIIEDEPLSSMYLASLLQSWCSHVQLVATARSSSEAATVVQLHKPDLIFLDIHLGSSNGFEILETLRGNYPKIIITTALADRTIQLIQPSGVPYLQKPVDKDDLLAAVKKITGITHEDFQQYAELLRLYFTDSRPPSVINAETGEGANIILSLNNVLLIEADGEYVSLHSLVLSKIKALNLSYRLFRQLIDRSVFYPVNKYQFINTHFVIRVNEGSRQVEMEGGSLFILSPEVMEDFIKVYKAG